MSISADISHIKMFGDQFRILSQQMESVFESMVRKQINQSRIDYFERLGQVAMQAKVGKHSKSVRTDVDHSRVQVTKKDYYVDLRIDKSDDIRSKLDPSGDYMRLALASAKRTKDDIIYRACVDDLVLVASDFSTSTETLSAGQTVSKDVGASNSDLNLEKILRVLRIYESNFAASDSRVMQMDSRAKEALMQIQKATSADYQNIKALTSGQINTFYGFEIAKYEVTDGAGTPGDPRILVTFNKDAIGMSLCADVETRVAELPEDHFDKMIHTSMSVGATRLEDSGVVLIECVSV